MKRTLGLVAVAALAASVIASPAMAQLVNFPVHASPNARFAEGNSVGIYGGYGRGLNDDSGKLDSFGGAAVVGFNRFAIKAGAASVKDGGGPGDSKITFGGQVEVGIFKPAESPIAISGFAGYGLMSDVIKMRVPFGLAIGVAPPMSGGTTVEIWGAARGELSQLDELVLPGSSSQFGFGASGGVSVSLEMGVSLGVAIDWLSIDLADTGSSTSGLLFGGFVGYSFALGSGM